MEQRRSQARATRQLKIIQEAVGHRCDTSTAIYTCVSSNYRTRTLREALDATTAAALACAEEVR